MPVLRGSVSFARFRAEAPAAFDPKRSLTRGLRARAFEPINPKDEEDRAAGFVELENSDATEFDKASVLQGDHALFSWRVDQLKVPAAALRTELERWVLKFEQENGRLPNRSEKAENKASLRHLLRARATPQTRVHDLSWNLDSGELQVWATSRKLIDEVEEALAAAFKLKLILQVPAALAIRAGIDEAALGPTPELIGGELVAEVSDGT